MYQQQNSISVGSTITAPTPEHPHRHFKLTKQAGSGSQGQVYLAEAIGNPNMNEVAIKVGQTNYVEQSEREFLMSLMQYQNSQHEKNFPSNIIKVIDFFDYQEYFITVMEKGEIDLYHYIQKNQAILTMQEKIKICLEVTLPIYFLHQNQFFYRDVKPENYLKIGNQFKLIDFGLIVKYNKDRQMTIGVGTSIFCAPEITNFSVNYTCKVDIWSLACLFYELFTNQTLFNNINGQQFQQNYFEKAEVDIIDKIQIMNCDIEMKQLMINMLELDANKRCDSLTVIQSLKKIQLKLQPLQQQKQQQPQQISWQPQINFQMVNKNQIQPQPYINQMLTQKPAEEVSKSTQAFMQNFNESFKLQSFIKKEQFVFPQQQVPAQIQSNEQLKQNQNLNQFITERIEESTENLKLEFEKQLIEQQKSQIQQEIDVQLKAYYQQLQSQNQENFNQYTKELENSFNQQKGYFEQLYQQQEEKIKIFKQSLEDQNQKIQKQEKDQKEAAEELKRLKNEFENFLLQHFQNNLYEQEKILQFLESKIDLQQKANEQKSQKFQEGFQQQLYTIQNQIGQTVSNQFSIKKRMKLQKKQQHLYNLKIQKNLKIKDQKKILKEYQMKESISNLEIRISLLEKQDQQCRYVNENKKGEQQNLQNFEQEIRKQWDLSQNNLNSQNQQFQQKIQKDFENLQVEVNNYCKSKFDCWASNFVSETKLQFENQISHLLDQQQKKQIVDNENYKNKIELNQVRPMNQQFQFYQNKFNQLQLKQKELKNKHRTLMEQHLEDRIYQKLQKQKIQEILTEFDQYFQQQDKKKKEEKKKLIGKKIQDVKMSLKVQYIFNMQLLRNCIFNFPKDNRIASMKQFKDSQSMQEFLVIFQKQTSDEQNQLKHCLQEMVDFFQSMLKIQNKI